MGEIACNKVITCISQKCQIINSNCKMCFFSLSYWWCYSCLLWHLKGSIHPNHKKTCFLTYLFHPNTVWESENPFKCSWYWKSTLNPSIGTYLYRRNSPYAADGCFHCCEHHKPISFPSHCTGLAADISETDISKPLKIKPQLSARLDDVSECSSQF